MDQNTASTILTQGKSLLGFLMAGPAVWEKADSAMKPWAIGTYLAAAIEHPEILDMTLLEMQEQTARKFVEHLLNAYKEWIVETGDRDRLLTNRERLRRAMERNDAADMG